MDIVSSSVIRAASARARAAGSSKPKHAPVARRQSIDGHRNRVLWHHGAPENLKVGGKRTTGGG
eukprot:scaffold8656_cov69-Phaeocystis_antarctica.AAC.9